MERKSKKIRKFVVGFLLMLCLAKCGYIDNDGTKYEKEIVGNLGINQQENSNEVDLVFAESDRSSAVVVEDCQLVYYDSLRGELFVKHFINANNSEYFQITLQEPSSRNLRRALTKRVVDKMIFESNIKKVGIVEVKLK